MSAYSTTVRRRIPKSPKNPGQRPDAGSEKPKTTSKWPAIGLVAIAPDVREPSNRIAGIASKEKPGDGSRGVAMRRQPPDRNDPARYHLPALHGLSRKPVPGTEVNRSVDARGGVAEDLLAGKIPYVRNGGRI